METHGSTSAASPTEDEGIPLFTTPSIVQVHDFSNIMEPAMTPNRDGLSAGASCAITPGMGVNILEQTGAWMSAMFLGSLDMHQRMQNGKS